MAAYSYREGSPPPLQGGSWRSTYLPWGSRPKLPTCTPSAFLNPQGVPFISAPTGPSPDNAGKKLGKEPARTPALPGNFQDSWCPWERRRPRRLLFLILLRCSYSTSAGL